MCIVSYLPLNGKTIWGCNRDEQINRATQPPYLEILGLRKHLRPKDLEKGGTWILAEDRGMVGILLNGAHQKHIRRDDYTKSRGELLPILFSKDSSPLEVLNSLDVNGFECFTCLLFETESVHQCVWDEQNLEITTLDHSKPNIWCSVTLYPPELAREIKKSFYEEVFDYESLQSFHNSKVYEELFKWEDSLRVPNLRKVSYTEVLKEARNIEMHYTDLQTQTKSSICL